MTFVKKAIYVSTTGIIQLLFGYVLSVDLLFKAFDITVRALDIFCHNPSCKCNFLDIAERGMLHANKQASCETLRVFKAADAWVILSHSLIVDPLACHHLWLRVDAIIEFTEKKINLKALLNHVVTSA